MDILNQIVNNLNKEEIRKYRELAMVTGKTDNRKDLCLFDYMRTAGERFDEGKALRKLEYEHVPKNRYYQLKNRMIENIGDSLVLLNTHKNELYELHQYMQIYHIFRSRGLHKVALSYLQRAQKNAISMENYEALDIVYSEFIKLCGDLTDMDPSAYIVKRNENALIVNVIREMDNTLAAFSYRLRRSQSFGAVDRSELRSLQAKVKAVSKYTTAGFNKKLESGMYSALSRILLQQHNYKAMETLVLETYQKFNEEDWFDENNHELKLQMLTYAANALFKNKKRKESLKYAEILGKEIAAYDKLYYDKYYFFYCNSLVNNYTEIDPPKALEILNKFEANLHARKNTYYDFYIYLNKAILLYETGKHKDALKNLVRLYLSDGYRTADSSFRLKVEIAELIMTYESGDRESLGYRIKQIRKSFAEGLKSKSLQRDVKVIDILEAMNNSPSYREPKIQAKIATFLKSKYNLDKEDSEIIKYQEWLLKRSVSVIK